jgi:hypothetical protein
MSHQHLAKGLLNEQMSEFEPMGGDSAPQVTPYICTASRMSLRRK